MFCPQGCGQECSTFAAAAEGQPLWPEGMGTGGWGGCCKKSPNSHQVPLFSLFVFENFLLFKPALQTSDWLLTQPNSPTRLGADRVRGLQCPTLPSWCPQSQWVHTTPVCLQFCPPCDFKCLGPSWCCSHLVWQGREPLTWLFPKSPAKDPARAGPCPTASLVPALVLGT